MTSCGCIIPLHVMLSLGDIPDIPFSRQGVAFLQMHTRSVRVKVDLNVKIKSKL